MISRVVDPVFELVNATMVNEKGQPSPRVGDLGGQSVPAVAGVPDGDLVGQGQLAEEGEQAEAGQGGEGPRAGPGAACFAFQLFVFLQQTLVLALQHLQVGLYLSQIVVHCSKYVKIVAENIVQMASCLLELGRVQILEWGGAGWCHGEGEEFRLKMECEM